MSQPDDTTALYFRMFTEIGIISQLSSNRLERLLPDGMSLAQFGVLNHLVRLGGTWSPSRLARAFQVTKGAMTNTLQRLEAQGLVRIAPDETDSRAKLVDLTPAGRKMRDQCVRLTSGALDGVPGLPAPDAVRAALPFLEGLRKALDEAR